MSEKKKILHIIDHLGLGGAQTIVKALSRMKNTHVYVLRRDNKLIESQKDNIRYIDTLNRYRFPIFEIRRFVKKEKIDILHLHLSKSIFLGIIFGTIGNYFVKAFKAT